MAYVSRQGSALRLMLMDMRNGQSLALTDGRDDASPSFAPNGRMLMYATRDARRDVLMTTTLDGRIKTRLHAPGQDMLEPVWGPFGR